MNSWRNCYFQKPEEAALDTSYASSVMQEPGTAHLHDKDQPSGTWFDMFGTVNRKPKSESERESIIDEMLQLKESCSTFHNYLEKMKEFQYYVDTVRRFTRPGCSPQTLDVALSSMSSLVYTLSAMSSKRHIIRASL